MTHQQIKEQLTPILSTLIQKLDKTENRLSEQMLYYQKNKLEWLEKNDFRPGAFSRILSSIVSSKFVAKKIVDYLDQKNWEDDYRENHMPELWKKIDYFGHFKDVALMIRFHLFHSVYSQIEATNRIIIREKNLNTRTKHANAVNELTKTTEEDFILFIDLIRNTIHNNGYHFPLSDKFDNWSYTFCGKTFQFISGCSVDLDFDDLVNIVDQLVNDLINVLKHPEVESIRIINDLT